MGIYVDNNGFKEQKSKLDLVNRWDAIDAIMGEPTDAHYPAWYAKKLESLPSAEPKTGKWIQKDMCADRFCSECNYAVWDSEAEEYNFCPNCGARMLREDGEECAE